MDAKRSALTAAAVGRPRAGLGHYLRDMIFGALDGVVTTLAVISGTSGAQLEPRIAIILGVANLAADGLSMGASNYLGLKSELEQTGKSIAAEKPWRHGLATAAAFVVVGAVPLAGYAVPSVTAARTFHVAIVLAALALVIVGCVRARHVGKSMVRSAAETLAIGLAAGAAAYAIGAGVERLTR